MHLQHQPGKQDIWVPLNMMNMPIERRLNNSVIFFENHHWDWVWRTRTTSSGCCLLLRDVINIQTSWSCWLLVGYYKSSFADTGLPSCHWYPKRPCHLAVQLATTDTSCLYAARCRGGDIQFVDERAPGMVMQGLTVSLGVRLCRYTLIPLLKCG